MDKEKKNLVFNILLLLVWGVLTLFLAVHHEIWRDEAQAWLVVRDLDLLGLIKHVRTEGHPLLWYFMIFPLAKLKLGVISMQLFNWMLVFAGGAFFVFKSPFNKFLRIVFLFSSGMFYLLPAFSRSYSLIPLLIFLTAYFYPKRKTNPYLYGVLLVLLANTHVIMFGFAAALSLLYLYELCRERDFPDFRAGVISVTVVLLSLFAIVLYLLGVREQHIYVSVYETSTIAVIRNWVVYLTGFSFGFAAVVFYAAAIAVCGFLFKRCPKMFFVFFMSAVSQFVIYRWVWRFLPQRTFTIILILLFCLWVIEASKECTQIQKRVNNIFIYICGVIFLLSTVLSGLRFALMDAGMDYSDSKNAAEFIEKNIPKNAVIVSTYDLITSGILAYLPQRKFYSAEYQKEYTYSFWTAPKQYIKDGLVLPASLWKNGEIYILTNPYSQYQGAELIYLSKQDVISEYERFAIYRLRKY